MGAAWSRELRSLLEHNDPRLSRVLGATDGHSTDLSPIDAVVELLINKTYNTNIVAADDVQPKRNLFTGISVLVLAYDTLDGTLKYLVGCCQ